MNFVALKMLMGDRAKYIGIIIGLTFASLLITQQARVALRAEASLGLQRPAPAPPARGRGAPSWQRRLPVALIGLPQYGAMLQLSASAWSEGELPAADVARRSPLDPVAFRATCRSRRPLENDRDG